MIYANITRRNCWTSFEILLNAAADQRLRSNDQHYYFCYGLKTSCLRLYYYYCSLRIEKIYCFFFVMTQIGVIQLAEGTSSEIMSFEVLSNNDLPN